VKELVRQLGEGFGVGKAFEFIAQAAVLGGGDAA
jgi:hypothetical protein